MCLGFRLARQDFHDDSAAHGRNLGFLPCALAGDVACRERVDVVEEIEGGEEGGHVVVVDAVKVSVFVITPIQNQILS